MPLGIFNVNLGTLLLANMGIQEKESGLLFTLEVRNFVVFKFTRKELYCNVTQEWRICIW